MNKVSGPPTSSPGRCVSTHFIWKSCHQRIFGKNNVSAFFQVFQRSCVREPIQLELCLSREMPSHLLFLLLLYSGNLFFPNPLPMRITLELWCHWRFPPCASICSSCVFAPLHAATEVKSIYLSIGLFTFSLWMCIWSFHFLTLYVYLVFSLSHLFQATDNGSVNSESVCSKRGKTNQNHCKIQIVWKDSNNLSVSDSNYLTVLDSKYLSVSDSKYLTVLDPRYPTVLVLNIRLFQILNSRDFADHPNPFTEPAGFRGMFPPSLDGPITPITNILSILLH